MGDYSITHGYLRLAKSGLVGADWEFTELKLWKTFDFAPVPASPDLTHYKRNAEPALNNSTSIC